MRSAKQRAASRRFFREWAPKTELAGEGEQFIDEELVGKVLFFLRLGIAFEYRYSFYSLVDGELYHAGEVTRKAPGVGIHLGEEWAWKASELRVYDKEGGRECCLDACRLAKRLS